MKSVFSAKVNSLLYLRLKQIWAYQNSVMYFATQSQYCFIDLLVAKGIHFPVWTLTSSVWRTELDGLKDIFNMSCTAILYCITTFIQNSNTFSITSQVSCNSHAAKVWSHKNLPQFFSSHIVPSSDTNWLFLFLLKGFWLIHWSGLNQGSSRKDTGHSRSRASHHKVQSCSCSLCKASTQLQSNQSVQKGIVWTACMLVPWFFQSYMQR